MTHSYPCGNKIDLVQHVDELLVCLFLPQELDDGLAPRAQGVPSIENVDDNVRGIQHLV